MAPRLPLLLGLCLLTAASACATPHRPLPAPPTTVDDAQPRGRPLRVPVLTLWHHGPMGSPYYDVDADIPEFVLYEDGLVVYVDGEGSSAAAMQARVSRDDVHAILDRSAQRLAEVPARIEASTGTDQPSVVISLFHDDREVRVGAYGIDRDGNSRRSEATVPAEFVELYRQLQHFDHPDAEPWQPDEIEVVLWRKDELRGEAVSWPRAIPLPPADAEEPPPFVHPNGKNSYARPIVFRVDGAQEAAIEAALGSIGEMTPIEWNGHSWLVRTRRVLPLDARS